MGDGTVKPALVTTSIEQ